MRIKILLFGGEADSRQFATILKDDEIEIVGSVADENSVLEEISRTSADIVLITDTSPMSLRACQQIYLLRPRSIPIVLLDKDDNEILQGVLSTGVHNILYKEMEPIHLVSEIKGIYANESNRLLSIETTSVSSNKSKVILVYGTKGGIGKSSVAVNLALKLSENRNKVAILDYNFQFGCVGTLMGLSGRNTISEIGRAHV